MSALESKLSKLEALAGIGLSPQEQLTRLTDSQSSETLLRVLALIRARKAGVEPPDTSIEIVRLTERFIELMASSPEC